MFEELLSLRKNFGDFRTPEEIREHYLIEKELAGRLRHSSRTERRQLYTSIYDEFFERVPNHPRLMQKKQPDPGEVTAKVEHQMKSIRKFLSPDTTFMEVGPGDCSLSLEVAKQVKKVYAVDVSTRITENLAVPKDVDFEVVISDGASIPIAPNQVNVVYSHQLMEHLHPDDAEEQLRNIYQAMVQGGVYLCITPHRLSGPHDISLYFEDVATGFHLKEYTVTELYHLFKTAGFRKVKYCKSFKKVELQLPLSKGTVEAIRKVEGFVNLFPYPMRRKVACCFYFFNISMLGIK